MKKVLVAIVLSVVGTAALACMPPEPGTPAYNLQRGNLVDLVSSDAVAKAILAQGNNVTIESILANTYEIVLSNRCVLQVERDFTNAPIGTCPQLLPLIVSKTTCP